MYHSWFGTSIIYWNKSFPLTNSYFSTWFLHHQVTNIFHSVGNVMSPSSMNDGIWNQHIHPASLGYPHGQPSYGYKDRSSLKGPDFCTFMNIYLGTQFVYIYI